MVDDRIIDSKYKRIVKFTDLLVWQKSYQLSLDIYRITKEFPKEEMYGLVDQMKRSVVSVSSNIAEGFSRQSQKEKVQFYKMAQGSLTELQNQLLISKGIGFLSDAQFINTADLSVEVHKLLNGLIKATKAKKYERSHSII